VSYDGQSTDTGTLANLATEVHQQDPGLLGQLLGAATGGGGSASPSGGSSGVVGGLVENAASGVVGNAAGDNPIAKAALAGITSYATKSFMGGS
jgi:hypothetical protein